MKKILFSFFILSLALFNACSSDNDIQDPITDGEEIDVVITADVPTLIGKDAKAVFAMANINSGKGGVHNVDPGTHKLRYILEFTNVDGTVKTTTRLVEAVAIAGTSKATFSTRLVKGAKYNFVVWADFTKAANPKDDNHYITTNLNGLKAIELKAASAKIVNDDTKDAYFAFKEFVAASSIKMTLKRPFGKVRYIATDYQQFLAAGSKLMGVTQKYTSTDQYTKFDATTGIVDLGSKTTTFGSTGDLPLATDQSNANTNEQTLYWDYLFAPEGNNPEGAKVAFSIFSDIDPGTDFTTTIGAGIGATAERNKLTTIRQAILTQGATIELEVSDDFDNHINLPVGPFSIGNTYYATIADALAAAKTGETVIVAEGKVTENLTIPAGVTVEGKGNTTIFEGRITLAAGAALKNAKSFYNDATQRTAIVVSGNNATLEGVIFDTETTKTYPEAIVTNVGVTGLKVTKCIFNEGTKSKYWKGLYLDSSDGVEITGCTFNKVNPFSTDNYVNTLVVTGNTFIRYSLLGDSQMIHLIATATTVGTDTSGWQTGLEATVTQIKTGNTWNDTSGASRRNTVRINDTYIHGETTWVYKAK